MTFVVGMNRDRDSYQVAAALAEVGELEALVTDYYHGRSFPPLNSLRHRRSDFIAPGMVETSKRALILQASHILRGRMGVASSTPFAHVDQAIARKVVEVARAKPTADLLIYSNYAAEAFSRLPDRRRVLFQFHPGASIIRQALEADEMRDYRAWQPEPEIVDPRIDRNYAVETSRADYVLCASSFTRRGLINDGVAGENVAVVPYGCPTPTTDFGSVPVPERTVLFVGQGVQRKGLHLLVLAWHRAKLRGWKLRIVCSRIDPAIEALIRDICSDSIELSGPVSSSALENLYRAADVLALPSLVEGFGLVLGEALAHGCRLLATENTGLVDMGLSPGIGIEVRAGELDPLVEALRRIGDTFDGSLAAREERIAAADSRSWRHFRSEVRIALGLRDGADVQSR